MTKKEMMIAIMERVADNEEMVDFLTKEIIMLDKKASRAKTYKSAKQVESEEIRERIFAALNAADEPMTLEDLNEAMGESFSSQKMAGLMRPIVEDGRVVKGKKGKKVTYAVAE